MNRATEYLRSLIGAAAIISVVMLAAGPETAHAIEPSLTFGSMAFDADDLAWPEPLITVPVDLAGDAVRGVDLVFRVDTLFARPADPFVVWNAFGETSGALVQWATSGDTIRVSIATMSPMDFTGERVVSLGFRLGQAAMASGCIGAQCRFQWLPGEGVNVNESLPMLTDGYISIMPLGVIAPARYDDIGLHQNAPNPFNPTTSIRFELPRSMTVTVAVYDMSGRMVRTLVEGPVDSGPRTVVWDGRDSFGREVASGVYLCRLTSVAGTHVRRMSLVR
jgi:hypothetical protein